MADKEQLSKTVTKAKNKVNETLNQAEKVTTSAKDTRNKTDTVKKKKIGNFLFCIGILLVLVASIGPRPSHKFFGN